MMDRAYVVTFHDDSACHYSSSDCGSGLPSRQHNADTRITALAGGGSDTWDNIRPMTAAAHIQLHKDNGDFKRWAERARKR